MPHRARFQLLGRLSRYALVCLALVAVPTAFAGSGKHLLPFGFFAKEGVRTPKDAWAVVRRTQHEVITSLTPERQREARLPLDIMIEALAWMRRRTEWVTAEPAQRKQLEQDLRAAISAAHDLHAEIHAWHGPGWTIKKAWERYFVLDRALSKVAHQLPVEQPRRSRR
ncbi:MAG: hypothetical protein JSR82_03240 [Verrucomicrobia bacterium]|nr:hypothetical protein [Verrucomicrobiota bacterium]